MRDIRDWEYPAWEAWVLQQGEKKFRASQIYQWIHEKKAESAEEMRNLPAGLREKLRESFFSALPETLSVRESRIDATRKYIFRMQDQHIVESVYMKYKTGVSVCISSQVGCRMGCRFCASTLGGLARSLSSGEMLAQVYRIEKLSGERVSHVVIMGSGEPLDNFGEVTRFVRMISDERGLHLSQRNITISTCGLVPEIDRLAEENYQITLALSLHAPDDEIRRRLMPIANRYPLSELMPAVTRYFQKTGRRITFEYSVVSGLNDNEEEAGALVGLLQRERRRGLQCHVNLIPVNPIKEREFERPGREKIKRFQRVLEQAGIPATIRREMGADISGACGQLRRDYLEETTDTDRREA